MKTILNYMSLIEEVSKKSKDGYITLGKVIETIYKIDVYSIEQLEVDILKYGIKKSYWTEDDLGKDNRFTISINGKYKYISIDIKIFKNSSNADINTKTYDTLILNFIGKTYLQAINNAREYFLND